MQIRERSRKTEKKLIDLFQVVYIHRKREDTVETKGHGIIGDALLTDTTTIRHCSNTTLFYYSNIPNLVRRYHGPRRSSDGRI
jgi:hypothetical protein